MANRAAGKGYENEAFYENMKFTFLGIENIHVMRSSLQKLIESKYLLLYQNGFRSHINTVESSDFQLVSKKLSL